MGIQGISSPYTKFKEVRDSVTPYAKSKGSFTYILVNVIYHNNRYKLNSHPIDAEKELHKIQYSFIIKTLNKLGRNSRILPQYNKDHILKAYIEYYTQW